MRLRVKFTVQFTFILPNYSTIDSTVEELQKGNSIVFHLMMSLKAFTIIRQMELKKLNGVSVNTYLSYKHLFFWLTLCGFIKR